MVGPTWCRRKLNRVTTPKLPPPPRSAQNSSGCWSRLAVRTGTVGGDDLDLGEVVDRPAEAAGQIAKAAPQGQAGHTGLGHEAEHGGQPVGLGCLVDLPEQTSRPTWTTLASGSTATSRMRDRSRVRPPSAHGGSGDVVAPALDAEQQPVVPREPDRGGDVVGRGRLEDEGGEPGRHAVPDRDGIVPTLVAGAPAAGPGPASPGPPAARRSGCGVRRRVRRSRWCSVVVMTGPPPSRSVVPGPARRYTPNASNHMLAFGVCQEPCHDPSTPLRPA